MKLQLIAGALLLLPVGPVTAHQFIPKAIVAKIPPPAPGAALKKKSPSQIEAGRILFERGTFGGNGRTCATCHPASSNFTLGPADVARLPKTSPLFVFERVPALAALENGPALRSRALILENLDGFNRPGVLRSVMHTFALGLTQKPDAGVAPLVAALGWSGDGSTGNGSLRNFAVGAVVQHFTKRLDRVLGTDFRMPTADELDKLEAFQLSLGRRTTPITDPIEDGHLTFVDGDVTTGQTLFHGMPSRKGTRRCSGCHRGGGALDDDGLNEQRMNGTELTPRAPACLFDNVPGDGGFLDGQERVLEKVSFCLNSTTTPPTATFLGNQAFNVQTVIEAGDTAPFFHDNSAATLEQVVDFYRSETFNNSPTGAGNGFTIDDLQRNQIAAFVRTLNVLENIRSALAAIDARQRSLSGPTRARLLLEARRSVNDAIRDLGQGNIKPYRVTALPVLVQAQQVLTPTGVTTARARLVSARLLISPNAT